MEQQLYELLRQCTVRVSVPGKNGHGTGFFVAPGLILTCAHVVKAVQATTSLVEVYWNGQFHPAQIIQSRDDYDLSLLQVNLSDHPCVYLSEEVKLGEHLCSYGYPDNYPDGDTITCECEGWTKDKQALLKFKMAQVRPGMSGAPLLNMNTGCVCGIIKRSSDRDSAIGGRAIPTTTVFRAVPELAVPQQEFHQQNTCWTRYLDIATDRPKQLTDRPRNYIPFPRNPLFQPRPGEFEQLEYLLFKTGKEQPPRIGLVGVGMVGMGGIGKTQLGIEFAYRYQHRFPGGVFWMSAIGTNVFDWHHQMAELAFNTGYLPLDDDVSSPENELRRAQYFCRYLARHNDALLILDNVEDPNLMISALPLLAGGELTCAILYTSRNKKAPNGVTTYQVEQLPEEGALCLLLEGTRPLLLSEVLSGSQDAEVDAARTVCQGVGYLPLALVHLRGLLVRDKNVRLVRLAEVLKQRGALDIAKTQYSDAAPLFATFWLSWEQVNDEGSRRLFELACYFPEAAAIPLWLLGLAAGLGENGDIFEPLGEARAKLQELSLLEELSGDQVRLHPLVREFGRRILEAERVGNTLLQEAKTRLTETFFDIHALEYRAKRLGYWHCLEHVRTALAYLSQLGAEQVSVLERIKHWMDRESYLLGDELWWPNVLPRLFYQQFVNHSLEESVPIKAQPVRAFWVRQEGRVGVEDQSLLRAFAGHAGWVMTVAFSPDGTLVLTGSQDQTARIWESRSGKLVTTFMGHAGWVTTVAFSPDGTRVLTGSTDQTVRMWDSQSGEQLATFVGPTDRVTAVAFSPDGTRVLTGSADGTAPLWDSRSGKLVTTFMGHTGSINSVAFSPDGTRVLTSSTDGTARLWDSRNGKLLTTFEGHTDRVTAVAFSPDGTRVLTGSADRTARLWDSRNGKLLTTFEGHTDWVTAVAFSPDGTRVLTGSQNQIVRLWESMNGQVLAALLGHTEAVIRIMFSPDGTLALTSDNSGMVLFWQVSGEGQGRLLGLYVTTYPVQAVCWCGPSSILLADAGGPSECPYIYRLKLEGLEDFAHFGSEIM